MFGRFEPKLAMVVAVILSPVAISVGHGQHLQTWDYGAAHGPTHWSSLSLDYALCADAPHQSPVDIETARAAEGALSPDLHYQQLSLHALNDGHTVQLETAGAHHFLAVGGKRYRLSQAHFHTPSEHLLDHRRLPVEAHFVHESVDGERLVLSVLGQSGPRNEVIERLLPRLPEVAGQRVDDERLHVDLAALIPEHSGFFHYEGSLTTPPCAEHVQWYVLQTPISLSRDQSQRIARFAHDNARPVQPLAGRRVEHGVLP